MRNFFAFTLLMTLSFAVIPAMKVQSDQELSTNHGHDPTKPVIGLLGTTADTKKISCKTIAYCLKSIIIGKRRRLALINDKFVSIGDTIGRGTVIAISKNFVTLSESGQTLTIHLFDHDLWN